MQKPSLPPKPGPAPPPPSSQVMPVAPGNAQPKPAEAPAPGPKPAGPPKQPSRIVKFLKYLALAIIAGAAYAAYTAYEGRQPYEWSGSIEARTVSVGSRVGGRVKTVLVHEGQQVQRGDVLIVLESGEYESKKLAAQAEVDAAEAVYEKLSNGAQPAEVAAASARLAAARAAAAQAYATASQMQAEAEKANKLILSGAVSAAERQQLLSKARAANASVSQAGASAKEQEAALRLLTAGTRAEDIRAARAQLALARTKLATADAQLEETKIRAPNAVRVESVAVRPGDLLKAEQRAATLLEVGQLFVRIYVPETHLGKIRVGQEVPVSVDSFPNRTFRARIDHISEVGEFTPRRLVTTEERADEVFAARLSLLEGDAELKAGMAAFIHVQKPEHERNLKRIFHLE